MSATSQTLTKKSGSSNSSMVNTPASTPVTTMANGQTTTQTSPPPNNNAPKYGTLVPNRIFVGGISANTTESELLQLFSNYGTVKAAKIIQDRAGVSKGYGFITFESEDDAKRLQREADNIVLRERKLNIAPAIKKQPFSRAFDASSPPAVATGNPAQYFFQPGTMPYFQGGVAYYPQPPTGPTDPTAQQPTVYQPPSVYPPQSAPPQTAAYPPVMFPAQPIYMPQQYPMPIPYDYNYYPNGGAQYMVGGQGGPQSQVPPMQRPNSPPRPPCYSQQLPPYTNPPDAMYYANMPIYGSVDGAMYATDPAAMDMSMSNGALPEDYNTQDATAISISTTPTITPSAEIQSASAQNSAILGKDGDAINDQTKVTAPTTDATTDTTVRKSNTPVVSILSLDQHQEKDPSSMQSGRRRKPSAPPGHTMPPPYPPPPNGFGGYGYAPYTGYTPQPPPPQRYYAYNQPNNNPPSRTPPITNGLDRTWTRKSRERRNSFSSVRTDSNSSASVVDENRNEEKAADTPPPPAPYSPIVNYNNRYYSTRNFQNSMAPRPIRGSFDRRCSLGNPRFSSTSNYSRSREYNTEPPVPANCTFSKPPVSPVSQMHAGNQHFVPPSRRNRRTIRRNGSASLSEIGGGDGPLQNADVTEACGKLDSLKL